MWLKYWAFTSMVKMGKLEKKVDQDGHETARFARRTEDTVAPFPPLNPRALALTLSVIEAKASQRGIPKAERQTPENTSTRLNDSEFQRLLATESFSKLYAQFLLELPAYSAEGLRETRGAWRKYDQGSDAKPLVDSLVGHPLEWCTAGLESARFQLEGGDFYVYYSLDENGEATIPRVAIRMEDEQIAEVRGIASGQELDPFIADIVAEKMQEFPDGEAYIQRAADMRRVTILDERAQGGGELSADDLRFQYQIDRPIEGFGYQDDPHIAEPLGGRDYITDMETIFATTDHNQIAQQLIEAGEGESVAENLDYFQGLDTAIAQQLIEDGRGGSVAWNLGSFTGLTSSIYDSLKEHGHI